ncbi:MAG: hypothetical protein JWP91_2540 [Fibrobacteres bacterium]|nr:hypothetical protein [Fibrobacterota bacterium]
MAYLAGNMHMDSDMIIASYQQIAAIGALALFFVEGALLALLAVSWKKPNAGKGGIP